MADGRARRRRSTRTLAIIGVIALAGAAGFASLGVWQLERLSWKNGLIAAVEARTMAAPTDPTRDGTVQDFQADRDEYRRVIVSGQFDATRETLTQAVTVLGGGFWVITPLVVEAGQTVLVNRGFVPSDQREAAQREAPPDGIVTVTGLLRASEVGGGFLRSNDPVADRWYSRDVEMIARARGLDDPAPFFIDQDRISDDYPVGGLTVLSFSNNHLIYALTWFALALMLVGAFAYTVWDRKAASSEAE